MSENSPPPAKKQKTSKSTATATKKPVANGGGGGGGGGHWSQGLQQTLADPRNIIKRTEHVSIIKDKYPKAKHHYLVIHRTIPALSALHTEHIDLVKHMIKEAEELAQKETGSKFQIGFHAVPSMNLLHLHAISTDFDSPCLKNKRHWNSFTSDFFMPASKVLKMLEKDGRVNVDKGYSEGLLKRDLLCHMCNEKPKNMPALKQHIKSHFK